MRLEGVMLLQACQGATTTTSRRSSGGAKEPFDKIVGAVKSTLEKDVTGISIRLDYKRIGAGRRGALIRGLDKLLAQETGLPVQVGSDPLTAVARGTGYLLENLDLYKSVFGMRTSTLVLAIS